MYARLSVGYGWTIPDETGASCPIVLADVHRYAGMVEGKAVHDGRTWARPMAEFDALSEDGIHWKPFFELRAMVPWKDAHVQESGVPLRGA